jgi:putative endonuclease
MTLGRKGEDLAAEFLKQNGYTILFRNYRTRIGEIDIIAATDEALIFCEVKTRRNCAYGDPVEAVTPKKQATIRTIAEYYLATGNKNNYYRDIRFDIITILSDGNTYSMKHYINAF